MMQYWRPLRHRVTLDWRDYLRSVTVRETPAYSDPDPSLVQARRQSRGRGHSILASDVYHVAQWAAWRERRPHLPGWLVCLLLLVVAIALKAALGAR